jgi:HSP20 family molecular chaperone IbpA
MDKGMKIQGQHEDKAEMQAALERIANQEFQRCFQLWERH